MQLVHDPVDTDVQYRSRSTVKTREMLGYSADISSDQRFDVTAWIREAIHSATI
jgi:hypothetical protein